MTAFPTKLDAPNSPVTVIKTQLIDQAIAASRINPRKRMILPLHKEPEAPLHRMLNAVQPFSYIRPHRHLNPPKPETILVLRGAILSIIFNAQGEVTGTYCLEAGGTAVGLDCEPGVYHTFLALYPDTVVFETKPGPFQAENDKDFPVWAPLADDKNIMQYMEKLYLLAAPHYPVPSIKGQ